MSATLNELNEEVQRAWKSKQSAGIVADLRWALRLLSASRRYDVVITGFERAAWLFALLRRFLFISGPPHIFLDAHPVLAGSRFVRAIRRFVFRQVFLSAERVVVFSVKQRRLWADLFDISDDKFSVIPYWATASVERVAESTLGDYIFAGGDEERDYKTLIRAMEGLPYKLVIAALRRNHFESITIPPNVEIVTVAHAEFVRLLSGAGAVVVPLKKDTIRYAGQQTYLNAMLFGKPVIVADAGADEYIKHLETGFICPPGDKHTLQCFIVRIMLNKSRASEIGKRAQEAAKKFTAEKYFGGIFALARRCASIHTLGIPNPSTRECEQ